MPDQPLVDITLGLDSVSLSVLHALSGHERPEGLHIHTRAYYNGRERGIVLQLFEQDTTCISLFIVVVNDRINGNPIVRHWYDTSRVYDAPPSGETTPQAAHDSEVTYPPGRVDLAVSRVLELVNAFAAAERELQTA